MTSEQIDKKARKVFGDFKEPEYDELNLDQSLKREGYIKALTEIESLPKIRGWIAREDIYYRSGRLFLFGEKPVADGSYGWRHSSFYTELDSSFIPDLTWVDGPKEVELIIRKK